MTDLKTKIFIATSLILFILCFGWGANSDSEGALKDKSSQIKAKTVQTEKQVSIEDKAKSKKVLEYRYNPLGRPDPFKPFISPGALKGMGAGFPLSPLQKFDINQLKLVGIIWGIKDSRAVFEDSAGKGYIVSRGTLIGRKGGKVDKIEEGKIIIKEKKVDYLGRIRKKIVIVKLRKLEGERK